MDIRQITYFTAIVREGSYSRAAEKLNITQPALSAAMKKLEEELGVRLLYSFGRRQRPTDEGLRLLERSNELLEAYRKTVESVAGADGAGAFNFGLSPLFGACFFGDLIPSFLKALSKCKNQHH